MDIKLLVDCQVGNGIIKVPEVQGTYETYRSFIELFEGTELPVRKVVALCAETSSSKNSASAVFGRQMDMQENMLRLIQNFSNLILPTIMEYHDVKLIGGIGDVWSDTALIMSHGKQVKPLNRVYLFHSELEIDVHMQTMLACGRRTVKENAADLMFQHFIPLLSHHALWDQVRFSGFDENTHEIKYVLSNFSEESFQKMIFDYLNPKGKKAITKATEEFPNYTDQGFWAEFTAKMRQEINFKPSDQRGWTAIMREFAPIRTLRDFEERALVGDTKTEVINNLSDVKMVSHDLAVKIVNYFGPKMSRRLP